MNFISLTKSSGQEIAVNPVMIVCLEPTVAVPAKTSVYMMGFTSFLVIESIEEIKKKIVDASKFTVINYDK